MRISVIIPVLNEAEVLPTLFERLKLVLDALGEQSHEICFVDDGSTDRSLALMKEFRSQRHAIKVISLSRNFGHQTAIIAGIRHASGDAVAIIDADLQDPPEILPTLVKELKEDLDVVYVRRASRSEDFLLQSAYFLAYRLINLVADRPMPLDAGDCCIMSKRVARLVASARERSGYLRGLRSWVGFRQKGIDLARDPRYAGSSKYSIMKLIQLALNGLISFSSAPLRLATLVGSLGVAGSILFLVYSIIAFFWFDTSPQGFTALLFVIVVLSSLQFLLLGLMGEYIGRIYDEIKDRPTYIVNEIFENGVRHDAD